MQLDLYSTSMTTEQLEPIRRKLTSFNLIAQTIANTTFTYYISFRRISTRELLPIIIERFSAINDNNSRDIEIMVRTRTTVAGATWNTLTDYTATETGLEFDTVGTVATTSGFILFKDVISQLKSQTFTKEVEEPLTAEDNDFYEYEAVSIFARKLTGGTSPNLTLSIQFAEAI